MVEHISMTTLLVRAGFPDFPLGTDGFPIPGIVIKYFRQKMKYIDPTDNKEKSWTQIDLAKRLGVSEVTVRLMETQNVGLDSLSRRRFVVDILKIPPVLLGLSGLSDLGEYVQHSTHSSSERQASTTSPTTKPNGVGSETLSLYSDALKVYWGMHYAGEAQDSMFSIKQWIDRVEDDTTKGLPTSQQRQLTEILCSYYQLAANVYGDSCMYNDAFNYLDAALELASVHENNHMKAAIFYRFGHLRLDQRKFLLAKLSLDSAMELVNNADPQLQCAIFQSAGLAYSLTSSSESDKAKALYFLDKAGKIVSSSEQEEDPHFVKMSYGRYSLEKADALLAMGRPSLALTQLDEADEGIAPSQKRRRAYINILRAEAYMGLKKPKLDTATFSLSEAFNDSTSSQSSYNIKYITRLHTKLSQSSYGNSTHVADLGLALRDWPKKPNISALS